MTAHRPHSGSSSRQSWAGDVRELQNLIEAGGKDELLPYYYHTRFRFDFDREGCLRCGRTDIVYCCAGLCLPCQGLINDRRKRTDKAMKRRYGLTYDLPTKAFVKRLTSARTLLADIRERI